MRYTINKLLILEGVDPHKWKKRAAFVSGSGLGAAAAVVGSKILDKGIDKSIDHVMNNDASKFLYTLDGFQMKGDDSILGVRCYIDPKTGEQFTVNMGQTVIPEHV